MPAVTKQSMKRKPTGLSRDIPTPILMMPTTRTRKIVAAGKAVAEIRRPRFITRPNDASF